jgi:hypothetical protein
MSPKELYAFYKRTSPVEDVRFFAACMVSEIGANRLHEDANSLLRDAEHGLARAEIVRRLTRLQERWRTKDRPAADEAGFWRQARRQGARDRGQKYREQRAYVLRHVQEATDFRKSSYGPTPTWCTGDTLEEMIDQVKDEVRDLIRAARKICPTIDAMQPTGKVHHFGAGYPDIQEVQ